MGRSFGRTLAIVMAGVAVCGQPGASSELVALFDAAGASRHLAEWPEANEAFRERARSALDPDLVALLLREVSDAFASNRMAHALERSLRESLSPDAIGSLAQGFTANGVAPLLGADSGLAAGDLRDFPGFASEISRQEVPAARFELVARLDAGTGIGRNAWAVTRAWGAAIERGTRVLGCDGEAAWRAPLSPQSVALRERLSEAFRERVHLELLFLARGVDTRELRRAVEFLESPPPKSFARQLAEALRSALDASMRELRRRLAPVVAEHCG